MLALFVARGVVDDVVPPALVHRVAVPASEHLAEVQKKVGARGWGGAAGLLGLLGFGAGDGDGAARLWVHSARLGAAPAGAAPSAADPGARRPPRRPQVDAHLAARHSAERLLRCWGCSATTSYSETKAAIGAMLREYLDAKDLQVGAVKGRHRRAKAGGERQAGRWRAPAAAAPARPWRPSCARPPGALTGPLLPPPCSCRPLHRRRAAACTRWAPPSFTTRWPRRRRCWRWSGPRRRAACWSCWARWRTAATSASSSWRRASRGARRRAAAALLRQGRRRCAAALPGLLCRGCCSAAAALPTLPHRPHPPHTHHPH